MPSDQDLLRQIIQRDKSCAQDKLCAQEARAREAFQMLYARYAEAIRLHVVRAVRDADGADDLVQETFLRVWTHAEQWNGTGSVKAWLYRIATNLALNHLRDSNRHRHQPLEPQPEVNAEGEEENQAPGWLIDAVSLGPDEVAEQIERHAIFRQLVDMLSEEKREVLRLVHQEDMELREVADHLGIPEGTVKSRLHYATRQLAQKWKEIE